MMPMPPFTVQDIVRATQGALVAGDLGIPVTGVSIDSRSLGVGEAFFAIHGHRLDGHAFLADAAARNLDADADRLVFVVRFGELHPLVGRLH